MIVKINLEKAKQISHDIRRLAREQEFAPYDSIVAKQIPGQVDAAEIERQKIRDKYAEMQEKIDVSETVDQLKSLLPIVR